MVEAIGTEARFAPGSDGDGDDYDWSGEGSDFEVVQAEAAASGSNPKEEVKDEEMEDMAVFCRVNSSKKGSILKITSGRSLWTLG